MKKTNKMMKKMKMCDVCCVCFCVCASCRSSALPHVPLACPAPTPVSQRHRLPSGTCWGACFSFWSLALALCVFLSLFLSFLLLLFLVCFFFVSCFFCSCFLLMGRKRMKRWSERKSWFIFHLHLLRLRHDRKQDRHGRRRLREIRPPFQAPHHWRLWCRQELPVCPLLPFLMIEKKKKKKKFSSSFLSFSLFFSSQTRLVRFADDTYSDDSQCTIGEPSSPFLLFFKTQKDNFFFFFFQS